MGRRRIPIKTIGVPRLQQATFNKRRKGLVKKAYELSTLCNCEVSLIILRKESVAQYTSHARMEDMWKKYSDYMESYRKQRQYGLAPGEERLPDVLFWTNDSFAKDDEQGSDGKESGQTAEDEAGVPPVAGECSPPGIPVESTGQLQYESFQPQERAVVDRQWQQHPPSTAGMSLAAGIPRQEYQQAVLAEAMNPSQPFGHPSTSTLPPFGHLPLATVPSIPQAPIPTTAVPDQYSIPHHPQFQPSFGHTYVPPPAQSSDQHPLYMPAHTMVPTNPFLRIPLLPSPQPPSSNIIAEHSQPPTLPKPPVSGEQDPAAVPGDRIRIPQHFDLPRDDGEQGWGA